MAKKSRDKGARLEREAARVWLSEGYHAERTAQRRGGGTADVEVRDMRQSFGPGGMLLPVHLEVKGGKQTPNVYDAIAQAQRDARPGDLRVVMLKRDRHDWLFVLDRESFFRLCREGLE